MAVSVISFAKKLGSEFTKDECLSSAAALAYYTIFSLPPLLVIIVSLAGSIWDVEDIRAAIEQQVPAPVAEQVMGLIENTQQTGRGLLASAIGLGVLVFSATGVLAQLQQTLNKTWEVEPDPEIGGLRNFLMKRLLSIGMILGIAFVLLVSLVLTTMLGAAGNFVSDFLPEGMTKTVVLWLNSLIGFAVVASVFAALFKFLPDAEVRWRDVWVGAIFTAIVFEAGKYGIGLYLGHSNPGSAYGIAGSVVLILIWIYYSSLIFLLGAEFTQVWARRYGEPIQPSAGAIRTVQEKHELRNPSEAAAHDHAQKVST